MENFHLKQIAKSNENIFYVNIICINIESKRKKTKQISKKY